MTEQTASPTVAVLGGGYAGTVAANHLRMRADVDVVLVNPRPRFVERIRLHQLAAGTGSAEVDYGSLLAAGVRRVTDRATRIDTAARRVLLASGESLAYDYVVYAVGSVAAAPVSVPGAAEHGHPVAELEAARRLHDTLDGLAPDAPVVVVGAGLTGIETASELAERGRPVTLVCGGTLGPSLSAPGRGSVARALRRLGVDVRETALVAEVRPDAVVLGDGDVVPAAVTVWTAGFGVPDLAAASGLTTDPAGRLLTDETLTSVDDDRVVAAGDAAAPSGTPLRMSCQAAVPLGVQAADTVLHRLAGTAPAPIDQGFAGSCISLGRRAATFQIARRDDTSREAYLGGRAAALLKEAICRSTLWSIRREARSPGSTRWLRGGARRDRAVTTS